MNMCKSPTICTEIERLIHVSLYAYVFFHPYRFFWYDMASKESICKQDMVVRTNCMDCLDRTNVAQSVIARHMLLQQFTRLGVVVDLEKDGVTVFQNFNKTMNDGMTC